MAGCVTFLGVGPSGQKKSPDEEEFFYGFSAVAESNLSDAQVHCQHCSVVQLKDLRLKRTKVSWDDKKPLELRADVPNYEEDLEYRRKDVFPLLPSLAESVDSGCGFCALLRNAMIWHFRKYPLARLPDDAVEITKIRHYWNSDLNTILGHLTFRASIRPGGMKHGENSFLDPCASPFKPCSDFVPGSIISPAGILTPKQWVFGSSKEKAALKALHRPTRLVHVGGKRESSLIHLVESSTHADMAKEPQPYLALSYSTRSNYSPLKSSISYNAMPKTYQDTVRIARALGESQVIAEIFRNSLVTIVPLRATSSDEGFLERNPSIKIPYPSAEWNISGSFFLRDIPFSYQYAEPVLRGAPSFSDRPLLLEIQNSAWHTRGWTFQEDMFAMRKLYIGQLVMHWDSLKPVDIIRTEDNIIDDKLDRIGKAELSIIHTSTPWRSDCDYQGWYNPMLEYGHKKLTYDTDRLPAVSSYAKLIASKSGDVYLAGLWEKNLHRGLLWKINRRSRWTFRQLKGFLKRPREYIAPSWSWARIGSRITWDNTDYMKRECSILEAKTKAHGGDTYGRWLAMEDEQYVAQCALDWRGTNEDGKQLSEASEEYIQNLVMFLVSSGYTEQPGAFSRRPIEWEYKEEEPPLEVMHGLLLYPTGKKGWRVGLFHSLTDEKGGRQYFANCEEKTMRIV
ncbi:heterokaryon incompatibility domain-containing protein [Trichoderma compactum]